MQLVTLSKEHGSIWNGDYKGALLNRDANQDLILENSQSQVLRNFENESSGWDRKFDGDNSVSGKPSKFKFQSEN